VARLFFNQIARDTETGAVGRVVGHVFLKTAGTPQWRYQLKLANGQMHLAASLELADRAEKEKYKQEERNR
jgi:hypothetical protein